MMISKSLLITLKSPITALKTSNITHIIHQNHRNTLVTTTNMIRKTYFYLYTCHQKIVGYVKQYVDYILTIFNYCILPADQTKYEKLQKSTRIIVTWLCRRLEVDASTVKIADALVKSFRSSRTIKIQNLFQY